MNSILVPLDGSLLAERALPYAQMLAPLLGAKIRLFRALSGKEVERSFAEGTAALVGVDEPLASFAAREQQAYAARRSHAEGYLNTLLSNTGLDVTTDVWGGSPAETIVEYADSEQVTMIVMATHGYSGFKRWTLGSVADKVVRTAHCPVLLVRSTVEDAPDPRPLQRILVPLDGSEFAKAALPLATQLAAQSHAELLLFQAVPSLVALSIDGYVPPIELEMSQRDAAARELDILAQNLSRQDVRVVALARVGYAAEEIVDIAKQRQVDLIVMATHGYSGLKRWALGSTADKVLHATQTPLLLVRPEQLRGWSQAALN
jgi:nucleotide-binding universal stress UspA family protein